MAKAESWQKTFSNLSSKTLPSEVFSLWFPFPTSSDLPNFPSVHTPVDCANQLSSHLQSHFSTQTPKPFQSTEKIHTTTLCTPLSAHLFPLLNSPQLSLNSQPQLHQVLIKLPTLF